MTIGFEYHVTYESEDFNGSVNSSIEVCIEYKVTDWGLPARILYDENDHPAEAPEIEVAGVTMEVVAGVWRPATEDLDTWAREWADDHLDDLIDEATR